MISSGVCFQLSMVGPGSLVLRRSWAFAGAVCRRVQGRRCHSLSCELGVQDGAVPLRESSPLSPAEQEHLRTAPSPYPKADVAAMTPEQRAELRQRSRSFPLVASYEPLDIVFEDDVFLVVSKPAWLKMHPIHRFQGGTLLNRVIGYLGYNPHMCHRLDMHTSGVVMFLKQKKMCAEVAEAFRKGLVEKQYLCIVDKDTRALEPTIVVDAPIERHETISVARQIGRSSSKSKESLTVFAVESTADGSKMALLRAMPKTGRTHQIRLHASHVGLPIVGDDVYGRERACYDSIDHVRECAGDPSRALYADGNVLRAGLKLHAWQVALRHPTRDELIRFCAPPPRRFIELAVSESLQVPEIEQRAM